MKTYGGVKVFLASALGYIECLRFSLQSVGPGLNECCSTHSCIFFNTFGGSKIVGVRYDSTNSIVHSYSCTNLLTGFQQ